MYNQTEKGGTTAIVLLIVAIAAGGYYFVSQSGSGSVAESATTAVAERGAEALKEQGEAMMDKSKEVMEEKTGELVEKSKEMTDEVVDGAIAEGKNAVGEAMKEAGEKMMKDDGVAVAKAGVFADYSADKVAEYDGAVLDFYASWCPSCRALEADIIENEANIPEGVAILKVDFDKATELKQKYGVNKQHTLVQVDGEGNEITKWSGGATLDSIIAKIN